VRPPRFWVSTEDLRKCLFVRLHHTRITRNRASHQLDHRPRHMMIAVLGCDSRSRPSGEEPASSFRHSPIKALCDRGGHNHMPVGIPVTIQRVEQQGSAPSLCSVESGAEIDHRDAM
jgi:hypothetical protein